MSTENKTLTPDRLAAIRAVPLPVNLDVAGVEGKQFSDEHEFTIRVPAWVLRKFKQYAEETESA